MFNKYEKLTWSLYKTTEVVNEAFVCAVVLQAYGEGSHYNEHEGLSSPFISSGITGSFSFYFTSFVAYSFIHCG